MSKQIRHNADVHSITDARNPHSDEIRGRMIKYSISMGIRLVCIVLVFFVEGWLQWVMIAGAVVLPYFAVIFANGGSDTSDLPHSQSLIDNVPLTALEPPRPAESPEPADDILQGEIIDDDPVTGSGGDTHRATGHHQDADDDIRHDTIHHDKGLPTA
ncbi:DUF3099 domain-containing protein [Arthrobacter sp. CAN_A1]|uniref:DUF3099 domain-containing protein n=1 Tax=Arthrobacter sp. CAN_A1 TaxID=2787717 RepID=UPI0018CB895B